MTLAARSPRACQMFDERARAGLDHYFVQRRSGPHSGPYDNAAIRRVRCADRSPLAGIMIKADIALGISTQNGL